MPKKNLDDQLAENMALMDDIAEKNKEEQERLDAEKEPDEDKTAEELEKEVEKPEEEKPQEEEQKEEPKPEEKKEAELKPVVDNEVMARLRFENAEMKRKLGASNQPKQEEAPKEVVPNKDEDPLAYLEYENKQLKAGLEEVRQWKSQTESQRQQEQTFNAAIKEFNDYQDDARKKYPDYDQVAKHMEGRMKQAFRDVNPFASDEQIQLAVNNQVLAWASQAVNNGYHPAEYLRHMGVTKYGYTAPVEAKEEPKKERTTNLEKVNDNRKKAADPRSGGTSKPKFTIKQIEEMSIAEQQKYTPEELYGN